MTKKFGSAVIGIGMLMLSIGCSEGTTPFAPSKSAMNALDSRSGSTASTTDSYPVVTLQSDLTAAPASVTVKEWDAVTFLNNSGRSVTIHSYDCNEFSLLRIPNGYSMDTNYFRPAGKKCNYFAWGDNNYSRQTFVGDVIVQ